MSRSYRKTESEIKKEKEEKSRLPDLEDEQQLDEIDEPEFVESLLIHYTRLSELRANCVRMISIQILLSTQRRRKM